MVGGKVGLGDLAVAVLICSKSFQDARRFLMLPPPLLVKKANWWGWWCRLLGTKMEHEMEGFKEYINAYTETPDAFKKEGEKVRGSAVPMPVRVAWLLMDRMTEEEAWNCPMSRAMAYFTSEAECKGQDFVLEKDAVRLKVI